MAKEDSNSTNEEWDGPTPTMQDAPTDQFADFSYRNHATKETVNSTTCQYAKNGNEEDAPLPRKDASMPTSCGVLPNTARSGTRNHFQREQESKERAKEKAKSKLEKLKEKANSEKAKEKEKVKPKEKPSKAKAKEKETVKAKEKAKVKVKERDE